MELNGLAKLTLLDFPGRTAATVFLAGCNMRCPFCHNSLLVTDLSETERIGMDEFCRFLEKRKKILDGIAVTGGEPTLREDIGDLLSLIKSYGYQTKLDTNGTNPGVISKLIEDGLVDYVAMDIKNSPERYSETTGIENFDMTPIYGSVRILEDSGIDHEFRTTVTGDFHTEESIEGIGKWLCGTKKYFLQNFVDSGALIAPGIIGADRDTMKRYLEIIKVYIPNAELRGL